MPEDSALFDKMADSLILHRQCWLGALAEVLIQMTIADVYFVHQRGLMNAIYIWVANVGSNLAVVAAGFITVDQGWR